MVNRKIWRGDLLRMSEGSAFYGDEAVTCRAGSVTASSDSEEGEPFVAIDGGAYLVQRSNLHELSQREAEMAHAAATILYAGLNQPDQQELDAARAVLQREPLN
jgi:hypothetical protein